MDRKQLGNLGEKVAAKYLKSLNYEILDTNYQNIYGRRLGEIDIIARDKGELVFVEVKTRDFTKYHATLPEENITYSKLVKLTKIANTYLRQKNLERSDYRFDAVSIWIDRDRRAAKIKHIPNL